MPDELQPAADGVRAARAAGSRPALAQALAVQADALVRHMRWPEAIAALDEATALHHALGETTRQAQCLRMAAALCRFAGDFDGARRRAGEALGLVSSGDAIAAAAWAELAETAMARSSHGDAEQAWSHALEAAGASGLDPQARAAMLRRRAAVRAAGGGCDAALEDLAAALALLEAAGEQAAARRVRIEQASALHAVGRSQESEQLAGEVISEAAAAGDPGVAADGWLLRAALAFERRDAAAAREAALQAREMALQAVAAPAYFAAARALSLACDALGERVQAYRALATAWATLGDLLGKELARSWVQPLLASLRGQWGEEAFAQVRARHDEERRRAMGRTGNEDS